jgi:hypothetical protein
VFEWAKTIRALDRAASVTGLVLIWLRDLQTQDLYSNFEINCQLRDEGKSNSVIRPTLRFALLLMDMSVKRIEPLVNNLRNCGVNSFCHKSRKLLELSQGTLQEKLCLIGAVTYYNEHKIRCLVA